MDRHVSSIMSGAEPCRHGQSSLRGAPARRRWSSWCV